MRNELTIDTGNFMFQIMWFYFRYRPHSLVLTAITMILTFHDSGSF